MCQDIVMWLKMLIFNSTVDGLFISHVCDEYFLLVDYFDTVRPISTKNGSCLGQTINMYNKYIRAIFYKKSWVVITESTGQQVNPQNSYHEIKLGTSS